MTFREAVEYLDSFANFEKTTEWKYPESLNLERMRSLAKALGNPQNAYESILIAGSKGKGSTAALLASILRMEDLKVGLYTSPHLEDIRERIRVNGLLISEDRFIEETLVLRRALDDIEWRRNPPTTFEALTALAFHFFKEMKVQVVVLEVGLGGLYDSTNIAPAKVVGLAPISLEHTDRLGKTLPKIAVQKCGVIKGREIVVSAPQAAEVDAVIQKAADEREAGLFRVGGDLRIFERDHDEHAQRFDLRTPFGNFFGLELGLLGRHQIENAALAVGLAKALEKKSRFKISESAVRQGILDTRWPGRIETVSENPRVVLDGAQNAESMKKLLAALKRHFTFEKLIAVFGVSGDKDLDGMLAELAPETAVLIATQAQNPRARSAREIVEHARESGCEAAAEEEAPRAFEKARSLAGPHDLILVTGSLFLIGELKKEMKNGAA
jgi:dihydrofolate synthase/folylpolyglutamate synthase